MSYTSLLVNTCTIQRYTEGAQDAAGAPAKTWAAVPALTDIACRFQSGTGRGIGRAGMEVRVGAKVVVADYLLFLGDVVVTEQDRVVSGGVTYEMFLVADKQDGVDSHHKECLVKAVR